jgi:hypothetical protein
VTFLPPVSDTEKPAAESASSSVAAKPITHSLTSATETYATSPTIGEWRLPFSARCWEGGAAGAFSLSLGVFAILGLLVGLFKSPAYLLAPLLTAPVLYRSGREAVRIWSVRLRITTAEVLIVGTKRSYRVPIAEVDRFESRVVHKFFGGNGTPTLVLLRREGEPIAVEALRREGFIWNFKRMLRSLDGDAIEVNSALAQARAASVSHQ